MKLSDIKAVTHKIEQGAWVSDLPNLPGISVKVRGYGNSDYRRLLTKLRAGMSAEESNDPFQQEQLDARLLYETILIDWHGIDDMPFSAENAETLLSDPDMAVFRMGVNYAASVVARDGQIIVEEAAKN